MTTCSNPRCPHGNFKDYALDKCKECKHDDYMRALQQYGADSEKFKRWQKFYQDNRHKKRDE